MPTAKKRSNPKVGTEFVKKFKGKTYTLEVVHSGDGIGFQLNRKIFSSPSAAGTSITGYEVNGWKFWNID